MRAHQVRSYGPDVTESSPDTDRNTGHTAGGPDRIHHYELRVEGRLSPRWSSWFDGLHVNEADDGTTVISGCIADEPELHGIIHKVRDLGLTLLSLTRTPTIPARPADSPERQ